MHKRVQIALVVLLVAVIAVVGWQMLRLREREPVYQGKRLSQWLKEATDNYEPSKVELLPPGVQVFPAY